MSKKEKAMTPGQTIEELVLFFTGVIILAAVALAVLGAFGRVAPAGTINKEKK